MRLELQDGDEWLSGLREEDQLMPVVTLVVYFGTGPWDAPTTLHGMLACEDERLLRFAANYRVNLLSPASLGEGDLGRFATELGLVLGYIRYAGDKDALREFDAGDDRFRSVDVESADLINELTDSKLAISHGEERVDMCQAIKDIRQEGVDEGMELGFKQGVRQGVAQGTLNILGDLVRDGVLTLADASSRAGLTPEEFQARLTALGVRW